MFGPPRHLLGRIAGPSGYYVKAIWALLSPALWLVSAAGRARKHGWVQGVSIVLLYDQATTMDSYTFGRGDRKYRYPKLALVAVWAFSTIPLLPIPLCALGRLIKFKMQGQVSSMLCIVIDPRSHRCMFMFTVFMLPCLQSALEMVRCQPGWPSYAERRGLLPPPTSPSSSPGGGASPSSSPSSSSSH